MTSVGEELAVVLEPLCLGEKELVLLAVNNSFSVTTAGGSHWCVRLGGHWMFVFIAAGVFSVGMADWYI